MAVKKHNNINLEKKTYTHLSYRHLQHSHPLVISWSLQKRESEKKRPEESGGIISTHNSNGPPRLGLPVHDS